MFLLCTLLPTVGNEAVPHYLFGKGGEFCQLCIIGNGGMAEPEASFLVQVVILKAIDAAVYGDILPDNPVHNGEMPFHKFFLFCRQTDFLFHKYHLAFMLPVFGLVWQVPGTGR